jgi:hypothetical protein
MSMASAEEIKGVAIEGLLAIYPDIDRLTMLSVDDWTEHDRMLAQAALCHTSAWLIAEAHLPKTPVAEPR